MAKSDPKKSKSKSGKKTETLEKLLTRVSEAAKEAVRAGVKAETASRKASDKKKRLRDAKAKAAAAKAQTAKAAAELRIAEAAAQQAVEDEKSAVKAAEKAKKKRRSAEEKAEKARANAADARKALGKHPEAHRQKRSAPSVAPVEVQIVPESDTHPESVPSELAEETPDLVPVTELETSAGGGADAAEPDDERADAAQSSASFEPVASSESAPMLEPAPASAPTPALEATPSTDPEQALPEDEPIASSGEPLTETVVDEKTVAVSAPDGDWTLARLRILARERGVRGYSAMSKARLLEVLQTAESQPAL